MGQVQLTDCFYIPVLEINDVHIYIKLNMYIILNIYYIVYIYIYKPYIKIIGLIIIFN